MLYQTQHSVIADKATLESGIDLDFPAHIHNSFEIIIAKSGEIEVTVGKNKYIAVGNRCILVFPNQLHQIKAINGAEHTILIFSPHLVRAFNNNYEDYVPKNNEFYLDSFYINKIAAINSEMTKVELKGLLYSVCGEFNKNAEYIKSKNDNDLLFRIFHFVTENYKKKCSLYELTKELNYNYVYLSQHFSKAMGISYTEYVCRFRINEACYLLTNTTRSVLDISLECGFDCLRSFNRSFKAIMGISPSEYKKQSINKYVD